MRSELRPEDEGQRLDHLGALTGAQGPDAFGQLPSVDGRDLADVQRVTILERAPAGWNTREVRAGEHIVLQEPKLSLSVDGLYAGIVLDPA